MYHFIYRTTNLTNGKYYIGRHSTKNINDGYIGSGRYFVNAVKKYSVENFSREILEYSQTSEELWLLEEKYITKEMLTDDMCYNQAYGGKSYLNSLKRNDYNAFLLHQSKAGKAGGKASLDRFTEIEKTEWHKKGRAASSGAKGKTWKLSSDTKYKQSMSASQRPRVMCCICSLTLTKPNLQRHLDKHTRVTN
jgi:hypothetical protein